MGTRSTSLSEYVSKVIDSIRGLGLEVEITPMSTIISSNNLEEILRAVMVAENTLKELGLKRFVIELSIDVRYDRPYRRPRDKVVSVLSRLQ